MPTKIVLNLHPPAFVTDERELPSPDVVRKIATPKKVLAKLEQPQSQDQPTEISPVGVPQKLPKQK